MSGLKLSIKSTVCATLMACATALLLLVCPSMIAFAATGSSAHGQAAGAGQGSTGYDVYRNLNTDLPTLTQGVQQQEFSSFDRTGGNADFNHVLRTLPGGGTVLAEHNGPGEVNAIWTTSNGGDVTQTGNIHVVLDGKTVVNASEQDVVDGKLGAPFVYPLVANASESSGGAYINVPMAFKQSLLIWTDHDPIYYHVWYRKFARANGVTTFNPADKASDVIAQLNAAGTQDPKAPQPGAKTLTTNFTLAPGASTTLATLHSPGEISALLFHLPQLVAPPKPTFITDDGRAFGRDSSAYSQFTVKIDPNNQGVKLTRRLDPEIGNQKAEISVDGQVVAEWAPLPALPAGLWEDQSVTLPASATAGKSQITIRNQFVSSDNDFNEFHYWVDSNVNGNLVQTDAVDVGPNHTQDEAAHHYTINEQTWSGVRTFSYLTSGPPDPRVVATNDILQNARLQINFDGQQMVDAPLGQFFGSGLGLYAVKSLMFAMDPNADTLSSWWPMPYRQGATVTLYNGSTHGITTSQAQVTYDHSVDWAKALGPNGNAGYFHTTSHAGPTTQGQDWSMLNTTGWGKFVGVSTSMGGLQPGRAYLEGDEHVYVDGSRTPQINGTGTEDFYQGGWYFDHGTFTDALNGNPAHETNFDGSTYDRTGTYRLTLAEAVPFHSAIRFGIEHGPVDDVPANYATTAYWYGRTGEAQVTSDTLQVGDSASELAHHYRAPNSAVTTLTDTFEGNDATPVPVTHTVSATNAPVSFTLAVDPGNQGVTLRRLSDQLNGYQAAEVYVDGQDAGTWLEPLANSYHRWLDDTFLVSPALTAHQHSITVRLVPQAGAPAWSAAEYMALS